MNTKISYRVIEEMTNEPPNDWIVYEVTPGVAAPFDNVEPVARWSNRKAAMAWVEEQIASQSGLPDMVCESGVWNTL